MIMKRAQRSLLMSFASFTFIFTAGSSPNCNTQPASLNCSNASINVLRGQCASLSNACASSGNWSFGDNLELTDPQGVISIQTSVSANQVVTRTLCVAANTQVLTNQPFQYTYSSTGQWGPGTIFLTTGVVVGVDAGTAPDASAAPDAGAAPDATSAPDAAAPLTAVASANPSSINQGSSTQLSAAVSGGAAPYSYSWTGGPLSNAAIANPIATPSATTTYVVVVFDALGNSTTASVQVTVTTVTQSLSVVASASPTSIIAGDTVQLGAAASGGTPPYAYAWTGPSLSSANIANPTATPGTTANYVVTVTDSGGMSTSSSVQVSVGPALSVGASATPNSITQGATVQLQALVSGGVLPYAFAWSGPALSNANIANPQATPSSSTTYTVTVTDGRGTQLSASVGVTVTAAIQPLSVSASASPNSVSPGSSVQLSAVVSGGTGPYSFVWSGGAVSNANIANPTATPLSTTTYTVIVTDPTGSAMSSATVTVIPLPLVVVASANPSVINLGGSSTLNAAVSGGTPPFNFSWSGPALGNASAQSTSASPANDATYSVTVTDSMGQSASSSVEVFVALRLALNQSSTIVVPGTQVTLGVVVGGGLPPYAYSWTPSNGSGSLTLANTSSPLAAPIITTTYTVQVTDHAGAVATGSLTVQVTMAVSASGTPATLIQGGTSQLDAIVTGGLPPYSYAWAPANSGLSSYTIANPTATPQQTTTYTVTVTDAAGTMGSAQTTVSVEVPPTCSFVVNWPNDGSGMTQVDASASTPGSTPIIRYEYTFFFDPNNPAQDCTANPSTCYDLCQSPTNAPVTANCVQVDPAAISPEFFGNPGDTVRVRVIDQNGLISQMTNQIPAP
jgi:hypothetical protein